MTDIAASIFLHPVWRLLVALTVGLVIGLERERRKTPGPGRAPAGLRTFALVALLGGLASQTGHIELVILAGVFVGAAVLAGYWLSERTDPGLTTEVALVVTFMLGVLAQSRPAVALGTSVVVTILLATREPLHRFVRDTLTEQELLDTLTLSVAALVVLPLLPDRMIGPYGLVNPFALWRLVVVFMGLSAAGHWASRLFGPRQGLTIAGVASGFISSSIAIATMGGRARREPALSRPGAIGSIASILGSLVYIAALVAAVDAALLRPLALPLVLAIAPPLAYALILSRQKGMATVMPESPGSAFNFKAVFIFAGLVAVFALLSAALLARFGQAGAIVTAVVTGLVDAHATAVAVATVVAGGKLASEPGALAIIIGLSANMLVKIPASFAFGPRAFALRVSLGLVLLLVGLWTGYVLYLYAPLHLI